MARMAGMVCAVEGCREAWCLREKRARKRRASGMSSDVRAWRRAIISWASGDTLKGSSSVAEGAILTVSQLSSKGANYIHIEVGRQMVGS